jgi:hypothetical protein
MAAGPPCHVELYADRPADDDVFAYTVRKTGPRTWRALVLYHDDGSGRPLFNGCEGDRSDCRAWLTSMGVPCLRIGAPQGQ